MNFRFAYITHDLCEPEVQRLPRDMQNAGTVAAPAFCTCESD